MKPQLHHSQTSRLQRIAAWCLSIALCSLSASAVAASVAPTPTPAQYAQAIGLSDHYASLVDQQPTAPVWVDARRFLYRRGVARPN